MVDLIVTLVIVAIVGLALVYIYRAKKKGVKCIGCPDAGSCAGHCAGAVGASGLTRGSHATTSNDAALKQAMQAPTSCCAAAQGEQTIYDELNKFATQ